MIAKVCAVIALVVAGLLGAVVLARPASAWSIDQLASLGYSVSGASLGDGCHSWSATGYGAHADFGSDCDPDFRSRVDAFVAATCPCAVVTTATTAPPTEAVATTTAPDVTVTTPPTTTAAVDPVPVPTTTTVVVTTADTAQITALQDQITALNGRVDDLNMRVIALETATGLVVYGTPDGYAPAGAEYQPNPFAT